MRIENHPILGKSQERKKINIELESKKIVAYEGDTIAAALVAASIMDFRMTKRVNEPRGVFCGIGRCTDCMMIVDGIPNVRTCMTLVRDGMIIERQVGNGRRTEI